VDGVTFEQELLTLLPRLRAYARSMARSSHDADDLVQDTVVLALGARARFEPGTNMRAWLFTILRNRFYNKFAANGRQTVPLESAPPEALITQPAHEWAFRQSELKLALAKLDHLQREALLLSVGAELSYAEIGQIIGCPVGTVKSRVFRARKELAALLDHSSTLEPTSI
jgi:RNA polymerase sigma-70 factor, ECF subfamily